MARGRYRPATSARRSGCAWQWLIIGLALGFGCAITLLLGGMALGQVTLGLGIQPTDTPVVVVITATPLPATPTLPPTNTPPPTATMVQVQEIDTPTPTPAPPTATPTPEPGRGNPTVLDALEGQLTELLSVAGGTFVMGTTAQEVLAAVDACVAEGGNCQLSFGEDSSPPHSVTLNAYRMERTEVTYTQYLAFLNALGPRSHLNGCDGQACLATLNETDLSNVTFDSVNYRVPGVLANRPVSGVTWYGARAYCEAIARRLPSEAEWERAARSNDDRIFPWGNLRDVALANTSSRADRAPEERGADPVASFPAGAWGLHDMAGNVAEWVTDWYSPFYYSQAEAAGLNPAGPPVGTEKVLRGGSWDARIFFARTPHRQSLAPDQQAFYVGFRCAADVAAPGAATAAGVNLAGQDFSLLETADEDIGNQPTLQPPPEPLSAASEDSDEPLPTLEPG
ncbi:MAG: SUMF1/EgtB/PvdO family nonheme iron enzyme [Anaerolineaceae bacterium]|nr:SUMF1/EgtB/PvdO family nonheme iron enzyme [Anaerolineaceae bacterium]